MIKRNILKNLLDALSDTPVVLVTGARQTGKSTLVKHLHGNELNRLYISLDNLNVFQAARSDPEAFINRIDGPVIIDEIQRVPELLLPIKVKVDMNRQSGQFILTGSANLLMLPKVSESLAGRMEILTLYPFSQSELTGVQKSFPDHLYDNNYKSFMPAAIPVGSENLMNVMIRGSYPEMQTRQQITRQRAWFGSYIKTLLERDIKEFSNIDNSADMFKLLALLAAHSGGLSHYSELSRVLEMPQTTLKRYTALLRATHLVQLISPWSSNFGKRLVRSPKLILNDTGLISYLLGIDAKRLALDPVLYGRIFECFVSLELIKQCSWSQTNAQCHYFRTTAGEEVDLLIEYPSGELVGIEIKSRSTVSAKDFKGLKVLQELAGKRFLRGIVLYTGNQVIPFGDSFSAIPVHLLWTGMH